jgi:geranylgeranylglycerol-phosphate geranylgeranyltransferase
LNPATPPCAARVICLAKEQRRAKQRQKVVISSQQSRMRRVYRFLRALLVLGHAVPTLATAVAGTAFFLIGQNDARISLDAGFVFISVYLILYSIGAMNDYFDEPLDRRGDRQEKPLVAGDLSRTTALLLWLTTGALGVAAGYHFSLQVVGIATLLWLLGLSYNLWAKPTRLSWLPFMAFYPSLPVLGFVAAGRFTPALLLAYPVGGLLSVGLNVANTIPDIDRDIEGGVSGFTHKLGKARALVVLWLSLAATMILMASSMWLVGGRPGRLVPGVAIGMLLLGAMIADWVVLRSPGSLKRTFYLSAGCAVVIGCAWVASLP